MDNIDISYPRVQMTYIKNELNITCRGETVSDVFQDITKGIMAWTNWVGSQGDKSSLPPSNKVQNQTGHPCKTCGSETAYVEGTSKKGNNYRGYKCISNKDHFEFLSNN